MTSAARDVTAGADRQPDAPSLEVIVQPEVEMQRLAKPYRRYRAWKTCDLIAVDGDPVSDITELEHVRFAMKNGKVIKNDRDVN